MKTTMSLLLLGSAILYYSMNLKEAAPEDTNLKSSSSGKVLSKAPPEVGSFSGEIDQLHSPELATISSLEKEFLHLEVPEIEKALDKLETSETLNKLVDLSNRRPLTTQEQVQLITLIRTKAALTKIILERSFEELEDL